MLETDLPRHSVINQGLNARMPDGAKHFARLIGIGADVTARKLVDGRN
jgi:hypothetical protein